MSNPNSGNLPTTPLPDTGDVPIIIPLDPEVEELWSSRALLIVSDHTSSHPTPTPPPLPSCPFWAQVVSRAPEREIRARSNWRSSWHPPLRAETRPTVGVQAGMGRTRRIDLQLCRERDAVA